MRLLFADWRQRFAKRYATPAADQAAFGAFSANVKRWADLNLKTPGTLFALSQYSDLTPSQFRQRVLVRFNQTQLQQQVERCVRGGCDGAQWGSGAWARRRVRPVPQPCPLALPPPPPPCRAKARGDFDAAFSAAATPPKSLDWRSSGKVTPVGDQGQVGQRGWHGRLCGGRPDLSPSHTPPPPNHLIHSAGRAGFGARCMQSSRGCSSSLA